MRKNLPLLAILLLAGIGCSSPRTPISALGAKPGWGRGFSPAERELTVRAVPASAAPTPPVPCHGRPGWGGTLPPK